MIRRRGTRSLVRDMDEIDDEDSTRGIIIKLFPRPKQEIHTTQG